MRYELLFIVPADLDITAKDENGDYLLGNDCLSIIFDLDSEWAGFKTPGTIVFNDKKLTHARLETAVEDIETLVKGLLISLGLADWILVGIRTTPAIESVIEWDEDLQEDVIVRHKSKIVMTYDESIINFYPILNDENDNLIPNTLISCLGRSHRYNNKDSFW